MTWNNHNTPYIPPELNELAGDAPMYLPSSGEGTGEIEGRDIFKELRGISLGEAAAARSIESSHGATGYSTKHGKTAETTPEGLSYSA